MNSLIYLDNAATTKTLPQVVDAMLPYFSEYYGNPSSIYSFAGKSTSAVTKARENIADFIGADASEIYLQPEEVNPITGHLKQRRRLTLQKESTL